MLIRRIVAETERRAAELARPGLLPAAYDTAMLATVADSLAAKGS